MAAFLFNAPAQASAQQRVYLDESGTLGYSGELFTMALVLVRDLPKLETSTLKHRVTQSEVKASQMKTAQKLALARTLLDENDIEVFLARLDPIAAMVCERKLDKEFLYDSMVAQALAHYLERGLLQRGVPYRISMDMRGGLRESYEDMVGESVGNVLMHRAEPLVTGLDVRFLDSRYSAGVQAADLFSNIYRTGLTQGDSPCSSFLRKFEEEGRVHSGFAFGLPELADQMTQIAADLRARVELERAASGEGTADAQPWAAAFAPEKTASETAAPNGEAGEADTAADGDEANEEKAGRAAGTGTSRSARRRRSRAARKEREADEESEDRGQHGEDAAAPADKPNAHAEEGAAAVDGQAETADRTLAAEKTRESEAGEAAVPNGEADTDGISAAGTAKQRTRGGRGRGRGRNGAQERHADEAEPNGAEKPGEKDRTASGTDEGAEKPAASNRPQDRKHDAREDQTAASDGDAKPGTAPEPAVPAPAKLPFAPVRDIRPGRSSRLRQSLAAQRRAEKLAAREQARHAAEASAGSNGADNAAPAPQAALDANEGAASVRALAVRADKSVPAEKPAHDGTEGAPEGRTAPRTGANAAAEHPATADTDKAPVDTAPSGSAEKAAGTPAAGPVVTDAAAKAPAKSRSRRRSSKPATPAQQAQAETAAGAEPAASAETAPADQAASVSADATEKPAKPARSARPRKAAAPSAPQTSGKNEASAAENPTDAPAASPAASAADDPATADAAAAKDARKTTRSGRSGGSKKATAAKDASASQPAASTPAEPAGTDGAPSAPSASGAAAPAETPAASTKPRTSTRRGRRKPAAGEASETVAATPANPTD